MQISFYFSAKDNGIVAVLGSELVPGAVAVAFCGTAKAGELADGVAPLVIVDDVIRMFREAIPAVPVYFVEKGGTINDNPRDSYELIKTVNLLDQPTAYDDDVSKTIRKVSFIDPVDGELTYGLLSADNQHYRIVVNQDAQSRVYRGGANALYPVSDDIEGMGDLSLALQAMLDQNPVLH